MSKPFGLRKPLVRICINYTLSILAPLMMLGLLMLIEGNYSNQQLYILFMLPVSICILTGGLWNGIISTTISALSIDYFSISPTGSLKISNENDLLQWCTFIASGLLVSLLSELLRQLATRHRLTKSQISMKIAEDGDERLHIIADNTYNWEYWRAPKGGYIWISPSFEAITGYPLDPFMGDETTRTRVRDIIHPDDRQTWENHIAEVETRKTGQKEIDLRIIKANGETIWISHICKPIYGSRGEFLGRRGCNRDVTERRKMVEELIQNQHYLTRLLRWKNNILDVSAFGMLVVTEERIITEVNNGFAEMFGYSPEEVTGCSVDILHVSTEKSREFGEQYWGVTAQKKVVAVEWQLKKKSGEIFWCSLTGSALDMQDLHKGVVWIIRDITERKQMELELRESELRFRTLFEQSIDAIAIMDSFPPCFRYVNPAFVQLFGYSPEEVRNLTGDRIWSIVYPEDLPVLQSSLKKRMEGKETSARYEFRIVRKDGEVRWVETVGYCSKFGDEVVNQSIYRDITERKRNDHLLRMREHEFRTLAESLPDRIARYDRDGRTVYLNPVLEKFLGEAAANMIGTCVRERHPDGSYEAYAQALDDALTSGENGEIEFILPVPSKEPIVHHIRMIVKRDDHGEVTGVLAISRDITKEKQAEQERQAHLMFFVNMERINQAIQGADDPEIIMKDLLDTVLSIFDCDRTFLMHPCDPESPMWTCPIECNKPEYPGILDLKQEIPMDSHVAETLRILLAADGPVAFGPGTPYALPEEVSKQFGFKCFLSMAIYPKIGKPWQFGVHQCAYARTWTEEEVRLFEAIGRRLADSLSNLLSYRDLRKNEKFLDNVVEYIPNMIFVKDAQSLKFVRFNKAGERLLGYSREDLLGKTDHDFFPKEEADFFTSKDRQTLTAGKLLDIPEESIRNRSNEERILHTQKIPILDEVGIPQFLLGISEDITERKQAEASISKLSQAIEQSPVAIVITDVEGTIEFVNTKFSQVTGYSYAEALGQNPRILKSGETTAETYRQLWKTIRSGGVWRGELHNRKKNGELFWEQATIAPVRNADSVITHYVAVKEDITELKKIAEQLRQAQKMEAVGQLAGGVAHDFNNMLGVIIGYAELTLKKAGLDDSLRKNLQGILTAGLRSSEITRQLLTFARKQTIAPKILDLNETIEEMLKLLRRLIGEDIDLAWLPGAKLWPVKMDPSQIDQILVNLCVNARDAIKGVGKVTIETHSVTVDTAFCAEQPELVPGEYVLLTVSDDGCGMDKETLAKLFEPFFTTKELGKGTGLGLATIYGIVKQNNAFINVSSTPGQGATFDIYLPRYMEMNGDELEKRSIGQAVGGNETILLVEDEPIILEMTKLMLEGLGYHVIATTKPSEAIQLSTEYPVDINLLVTDVILPEMNGRELGEHLISFCPNLKILFMSGYSADVIAHHGVLEEGVQFIQKPFTMQDLSFKIRDVLD